MPDKKPVEISFVSSDTFREIFQTSAEGIIMVDASGKILLANPVSEKMFGYPLESLPGNYLESLLPERYRNRHVGFRQEFNENPSPRRMGIGRDLQARRMDGSEFPVEISLSYTKVNGHLLSMAFITDISQRKTAEQALKKSEEQLIEYAAELEQKVLSRTEALNLSIWELEKVNGNLQKEVGVRKLAEDEAHRALGRERELNELKSKFVSIASHEFRTPLSAILSSASLITQYRERAEPEKVDKHLERIKTSVNHLTLILNDFLSLGKLEEGRIEVTPAKISLQSFFTELEEEVRHLLKEGQTIAVDFGSRDREFTTDPHILRSALFNLLSNASKYADPGKAIALSAVFSRDSLSITVKDDGIGIPESETRHIFERFFRASNSGTVQGTGLGLNIVKRYVELLKGEITFQTEEGKGSAFTITLPV